MSQVISVTGNHQNYTYDPARRWLDTIKTVNTKGKTFQNITYSFDAVGNVLGYENDCLDSARGNYRTSQTYAYDDLYQLINVNGNTTYNPYQSSVPEFKSTYSQAFEFDSDGLGNMVSKVSSETVTPSKSIGDNLNYNFNYTYDKNYAHRLVNVGDRYYQYDSNGNVVCEQDGAFDGEEPVTYHKITQEAENVYSTDYGWGLFREKTSGGKNTSSTGKYRRTYTWDERNLLISSVDSNYSVSYVYGQDGQRSNKYTDSSETLYFNNMWTLHTDSGNIVDGGQYAKNIYLGDTRIVTKLKGAKETTTHEETYKQYFYHSDHLGSATLITDYKGDEYQRIEYTPYGETWVEKTQNTGLEYLPYKFTGKEMDEETGLYYYGARYLDPKYSRWISTDPALGEYIPAAGKGNSENAGNLPGMGGIYNHINGSLYHYAANNPVRYTDPDGEKLYVCGSKEYMGAVQRELTKLCDGAIINFDTGEVTLSSFSKESNPKGYEILSNLIESPKINTICLGDSKNAGNSTINYNTIIFLKDGKFYRDKTNGAQNSLINFDPNNWDDGGVDDSGSTRRPPYVGLSHEMGHSEAINRGSQTYEDPIPMPKTTPKREENAMKRENQIRAEHNLTKRTWYYQSL